MGSLILTVIALTVAWPLGVGAAIYLSEYANPRVRRIVKPVVEVLASIPSVVVGYFAIRFIAPELVQKLFTGAPAKNLLVAGLAVGLLTIPLMTSVAEDALRAVPLSLREASYGLGAKKVTTVVRVVVPAAVSGLVAGLILSISRAIGETMVVFLAAGGSGANLSAFQISTDNSVTCGRTINLTQTMAFTGGTGSAVLNFALQVGGL